MVESAKADTLLSGYAIGVDIGGTFTDCVVVSPDGSVIGGKSPTTPHDRSVGFFNAIDRVAEKLGIAPASLFEQCERLVHGTTTGTNAIVSRDGATTALITTAGHRDIMFLMAGGGRTSGLSPDEALHVPSTGKPDPLVPKRLVAEIAERIDVDGDIIAPLDEASVREAVRHLVEDEGAESIAVSLIWAVKNNVHEQRVKRITNEMYPDLFVTAASELVSQVGEYERTTTAVMNAYIGPLMTRYIKSIEDGAAERGYQGRVLFAQCAGGAITGEEAKLAPIRTVNSGPVAGVVSSELLAHRIDTKNVLLADMGGTTFDVSVIRNGSALRRSVSLFQRYELALPMLDIESIGAGGGSIAWVDKSGRLTVGPKSAGANPGPAAYGAGGTEATVTDADIVLGFINPVTFLNGKMPLDPELSVAAIKRVADPLGIGVNQAAAGISRIVDSKMADLIRRMSVLRGLDPRQFTMYAFGGGGPVHAAAVAREAGIKQVVIPLPDIAAMWSAFGAALADVAYVYQAPKLLRLPASADEINEVFTGLETRAMQTAEHEGLSDLPFQIKRSVRMKYGMQVHDVEVPVKSGDLLERDLGELERGFSEIYESIFGEGSGYGGGGIDITSFQVRYQGLTSKPTMADAPAEAQATATSTRPVYWVEHSDFVDTPVIRLGNGVISGVHPGPLLMELPDSVVVVRPGMTASFDGFGNLLIDTGI